MRSSDLASRPVAGLAPPGTTLLEEHGLDEGVGHGFGGNDRSAILRRWWRAPGTPGDLLAWFDGRLGSGGWIAAHREEEQALFLRGSEQLFVAIRSVDGGAVTYEVGYSDQSDG